MQTLHSFADHVGGLSTQTIETRTHRFHSQIAGSSSRCVSTDPTKFLFSYPSLFSASRSNPDSACATSVNNGQAPLGFQVQHIPVGNQFSFNRINYLNQVSSQNKFGFNPEDVYSSTENNAENQIANNSKIFLDNPKTINGEEHNQYIRTDRPSEVAAGSKGFIHHPSIAGEGK